MYRAETIDELLEAVPARLIATSPVLACSGSATCRATWERVQPSALDYSTVLIGSGDPLAYTTREASWATSEAPLASVAQPVPDAVRLPADATLGDALDAILRTGFCLVEGEAQGIVTEADFGKPAACLWALGVVLSVEDALMHLFPSSSDGLWKDSLPDDARRQLEEEVALRKENDTFLTEEHCLPLGRKLGLGGNYAASLLGYSKRQWKGLTGSLPDMRNDLAHGRPLGTSLDDGIPGALSRLAGARALARDLWRLADDRPALWESFRTTAVLFDSAPPPDTCFWMLSAQNPGEKPLSESDNDERHRALCDRLRRSNCFAGEARGRSSNGTWQERMALMAPGSDDDACELARDFGKRAVFRIEGNELVVVDAATLQERGRRGLGKADG